MAWIASVGGGAGIWVKLPGEENLTMSRNCKSSLAWALLATLLLTRVLLAQSPNADLILIHGHILTLDGTDSLAQAMAIRQGVIVKRSEEHTSELQSRLHLVCRLLLEKKKKT